MAKGDPFMLPKPRGVHKEPDMDDMASKAMSDGDSDDKKKKAIKKLLMAKPKKK